MKLLLSGYSSEGSPSIACYQVMENSWEVQTLWVSDPPSPSFACMAGEMLIAGLEHSGGGEALLYAPTENGYKEVDRLSIQGGELCHLSYDPSRGIVYGSCYEDGRVAVIGMDGKRFTSCTEICEESEVGSRAHCCITSPDGRYVYAVNIQQDRIYCYLPGRTLAVNASFPFLQLAKGEGPRHICFHPTLPRLCLVTEYSSRVYVFSYEESNGSLYPMGACSALPESFQGESFGSGLVLSKDGSYAYAGNRGADTIAVLALFPGGARALPKLQDASCGGRIPRHIALSRDGRFLLSANQSSQEVSFLPVGEDGALGTAVFSIPFSNPSFVQDITEA